MYVEGVLGHISFFYAVQKHPGRDEIAAAMPAGPDQFLVPVVPVRFILLAFLQPFRHLPAVIPQKHLIAASADVFDLTVGPADTVGVFVCSETGAAEDAENGAVVILRKNSRRRVPNLGSGRCFRG